MLSRPEYENSSPDEPRNDLGGWYTGPSTSGDPSTSGGPSDVTDAPKTSLRRAKRVIPDEEKDDRYWAKRMRNNKAAKRSRENKRTMELEIRNRANHLEEQNALLTKELFVIKRQYGLPLDRSILSAEEQAQCIQDLKNSRAYLESQAFKMDQTENSTSPGMYPVSMAPMSHGDSADLNGRCVPLTRSDGKLMIKEEPPESLCSDPGKFVQKGDLCTVSLVRPSCGEHCISRGQACTKDTHLLVLLSSRRHNNLSSSIFM
ncbi:nuclear factor interleukin-3-regulated protein-like [Pomacea canaliculata]|uniref:nuclear factor interleukin-3-regulated protein-like n=1 Tax=Pomacea canaliculata TaxID=400727 RepID=UPI000D73F4CA|nr:nuclear factor interleukin-3-regulated protein-like [Pomacea canaliculata]XP_025108653.1 nuclear factor interleukin-3-regulated protein-like [Pomacea canaliculata]